MIYNCANCGREIEVLRTDGKEINEGFYCGKCAHEFLVENTKRKRELVENHQNQPQTE